MAEVTPQGSVIELEGLTRSYRRSGFRLGPLRGELVAPGVTALLGRNGAGKTTLLTILSERYPEFGIVPQAAGLPGHLTVRHVLTYLALLRRVPRGERRGVVEAAAQRVDATDLLDRRCGTLSGGQARRVLIAQALLTQPEVILLDEPSAGLDIDQRERLHDLIGSLRRECGVVVSTHLVEDVRQISDRVLVLDNGQFSLVGSTDEFLAHAAPGTEGADAWISAFRSLAPGAHEWGAPRFSAPSSEPEPPSFSGCSTCWSGGRPGRGTRC